MPSAVEGWGEKEICIKGVNYSQKDGEGEGGVIECLSAHTPTPLLQCTLTLNQTCLVDHKFVTLTHFNKMPAPLAG